MVQNDHTHTMPGQRVGVVTQAYNLRLPSNIPIVLVKDKMVYQEGDGRCNYQDALGMHYEWLTNQTLQQTTHSFFSAFLYEEKN